MLPLGGVEVVRCSGALKWGGAVGRCSGAVLPLLGLGAPATSLLHSSPGRLSAEHQLQALLVWIAGCDLTAMVIPCGSLPKPRIPTASRDVTHGFWRRLPPRGGRSCGAMASTTQSLGCAGMVFGQSQQARRLRRLPLCGLIQLHAELQWEGVAHSRNMLGHDLKQQHQLETMAMA